MPEHVVVGRETAAGHADEMKSIEFKIVRKGVQIIGDGAGLGTGGRIRRAAAPAAPVEGDDPISRRDETWNVVLPTVGVAGVSVKQHERHAVPAAVGVPQAHTRQIGKSRELRRKDVAAVAIRRNHDPSPTSRPRSAAAMRPTTIKCMPFIKFLLGANFLARVILSPAKFSLCASTYSSR